MKENIRKILENGEKKFKKYFSTNILFSSYVILSLFVGILLRTLTVGNPLALRAILGDLTVVLVIGAFGYLIKPKKQFLYFFAWLLLYTFLGVANAIYYEFYQSFVSINLIATLPMVVEVDDSVYNNIKLIWFVYIIAPIIMIFIHTKLSKRKYYFEVSKVEKGKKMFVKTGIVGLVGLSLVLITLTGTDYSRLMKQWNREYLVQRVGLYTYTVNDFIQSIKPKINTLFGFDEAVKKFNEFYSEKEKEKVVSNSYTNKFKGKNVIFIHAESMQNFLIGLKINGKEVTPTLNKMAKQGLYFSSFYPQISVGTSSDTEFTLNTGLMPSSSGTVFVSYSNRTYEGMPSLFKGLGYYTFSMHANNGDYWNRNVMHKNLGYTDFFSKDSYEVTSETTIGLGLSDKEFFNQITPMIKEIKSNKSPFMATIITLSNHSPFSETDKYGDFDVTMSYKSYDEDGNKLILEADYLKDSYMGNYIQSVHYADAALGQFLKQAKKAGILENTVIVLYGDHDAKLAKNQFELLYNYDPETDDIKSSDDPTYISMENYAYDLLKNTPLIVWSSEESYKTEVKDVMGMYDMLPTIGNMFGFSSKYALGYDIFSNHEKVVIFPNGNFLTNQVYYNNSKDEYILLTNEPIDANYINRYKEYTERRLEVSNAIVVHDLISKVPLNNKEE